MRELTGKSLIVENVKYVICKNINHTASSRESLDLKDGISFVGSGIEEGAILGIVHKIGNISENKGDAFVPPLIMFCETLTHANAMFKNFINDKLRFNQLTAEIQKQKIMDKAKNQSMFYEVKEDSNAMSSSKVESMGKRLALNNGIFKPNDNY